MTIDLRLDRGQRRRMKRLLHGGLEPSQVAVLAGCARATVYRTVYRFEDLGEDGLLDRRAHRAPRKVTPAVESALVGYIDRSPQDFGWQRTGWTLELLAAQLVEDTGVLLSPSHVRNLLLANDVRRGRPRVGLRIPVRGRRQILRRIDRLVKRVSRVERGLHAVILDTEA